MTNASNTAVGAAIQQLIDNTWRPIAFFSKTLKPQETRYSTFGCELFQCIQPSNTFDILLREVKFMYQPTTNH